MVSISTHICMYIIAFSSLVIKPWVVPLSTALPISFVLLIVIIIIVCIVVAFIIKNRSSKRKIGNGGGTEMQGTYFQKDVSWEGERY